MKFLNTEPEEVAIPARRPGLGRACTDAAPGTPRTAKLWEDICPFGNRARTIRDMSAASTLLVGLVTISAAATLAACTAMNTQASQPAPSSTAAAVPAPSEDVPCQDQFTAEIIRGTDPAAPNTAYIALTNTGDAVCSLSGFPSESAFLGASGPIETVGYGLEGAPTADAYGRAGDLVTVDPGGRAFIWARIALTADRAGDDPCELPVATTGVTLTLPAATAPVVAPLDAEVCLDTDADDLQVGPVDSQPRPASAGG